MQEGKEVPRKLTRKEKLEQRKAQIENQLKEIEKAERAKERRARTRRLIQIGAISLKIFNLPPEITPEDYEKFARQVAAYFQARQQQDLVTTRNKDYNAHS